MTEVYLILLLTALSTSIIGVFLVLRDLSMTADAISHSILLGIVLGYLISKSLDSPLLFVGALIFGLLTVVSVEILMKTKRVHEDAALGIVFPLFFSIGVILLSKYLRNVHLCVDSVIMGEVILAPLHRTVFLGLIEMPMALKQGIIILTLNILYIVLFYKELKLSTFDKAFAIMSGFSVPLIHYSLMTLISLNAVMAFDAVGSILVISFLVAPAATAIKLTKNLFQTLLLSAAIAVFNTTVGYFIAIHFNVNIAGVVAFVGLLTFLIAKLFEPEGFIRDIVNKREQRRYMNRLLIITHIKSHQNQEDAEEEVGDDNMQRHLRMKDFAYEKTIQYLLKENYITKDKIFQLTEKGEEYYRQMMLENGLMEY
ncbi:MAG: metal ABC transporter permease [Tissierellia bacterium]|nr:metal ABC transporter permease [Tissierellia bacterium]